MLAQSQTQSLEEILYPPLEPYKVEQLKVSDIHNIYFEQSGNPQGKPVLFVHGGPGGGTQPNHRRYFNPKIYRIILVDQRGCGKSTPHAELKENTTSDLIEDFEKIRTHLNIEKWQLFGGSWGSSLALAYGQRHPQRVTELVLRGIFLLREKELSWMYQWGASEVFPEMWAQYLAFIPENERHDLRAAYHKRLTGDDRALQYEAAKIWSQWEATVSKLYYDPKLVEAFGEPEFALAFARIESHYFKHKGFLGENQLLKETHKIAHIPGVIIHGRYDMCCPVTNAWDLHKVWPKADLCIIPDAGHALAEIGIAKTAIQYTNLYGGLS